MEYNIDFRTHLPVDDPADNLVIFKRLCEQIAQEQHLLPQQANNLLEQLNKNLSIVVISNGEIIGHTTLWSLGFDENGYEWFELGTTYVHPNFRGQGLNHKMYANLFEVHKDKNILATTTNAFSIKIGKDFEMVTVNRNSLPVPILKETCCCSKTKTQSDNNISYCALEYVKDFVPSGKWSFACHIRVSKQTFKRNKFLTAVGS